MSLSLWARWPERKIWIYLTANRLLRGLRGSGTGYNCDFTTVPYEIITLLLEPDTQTQVWRGIMQKPWWWWWERTSWGENIATKIYKVEKNITARGRRQKYNVERRAMRHFSVPDTTGLGSGAGRARQWHDFLFLRLFAEINFPIFYSPGPALIQLLSYSVISITSKFCADKAHSTNKTEGGLRIYSSCALFTKNHLSLNQIRKILMLLTVYSKTNQKNG